MFTTNELAKLIYRQIDGECESCMFGDDREDGLYCRINVMAGIEEDGSLVDTECDCEIGDIVYLIQNAKESEKE